MHKSGFEVNLREIEDPDHDELIQQIFEGKDREPITEILIMEMISKGIPEDDLRYMASAGFTYCRKLELFFQ